MLQEVFELISEIVHDHLIDKPYKGEKELYFSEEDFYATWHK
jgi:hypothetical protein